MVEVTRASNGKFVAKPGGAVAEAGSGDNDNDGTPTESIDGLGIIDPGSITSGSGGDSGTGEPVKRGRGRPSAGGSGRKSKPRVQSQGGGQTETKAALDLSAIKATLYSIHLMAAQFTSTPEIALSGEEAGALGDGIKNVARHYNLETTQKTMDWTLLCVALATIYGPKFYMIAQRKKAENAPVVNSNPNGF